MQFTFQAQSRLYTVTEEMSPNRDNAKQKLPNAQGNRMDTPISQTNVSLNLSLIQKRCEELIQEDSTELCLEEPSQETSSDDSFNPYNRS